MNEIWKDIKGYEGLYQISNLGRVKSLSRMVKYKQYSKETTEKIMKLSLNKRGYLYVGLCKNGSYERFRVHRLVALHFVPNPKEYSEVNHKDRIKTNNEVENLEWCSGKENVNHSIEQMKKPHICQTNTGHHHISKKGNGYRVRIGKKEKYFKELGTAITFRDEFLKKAR
jgi:hypothetical protein